MSSTVQWWARYTMTKWTTEQASKNVLMRIMNFHSMKGHHSKSLKVDKLTRGLSFSGLPFPLTAKSRLLPVSYDEKSCLVQTQVSCDFRRFQLTVRMRIRAWGLIQGKEQVELKQAQELFCLRELVVSSNPRSELGTAKMPFFLKSQSKRWLFGTLKRQPTW